jgi:hypothetical protein
LAQCLAVALVLGVLGCHRAASEPEEPYWCGNDPEPDEVRPVLTLGGPASSGLPLERIGDPEFLAILSDSTFDRCGDEPRLRDREFTQEQAFQLAEVLYMRAKELEASDDHVCRLSLLEKAYYLVPGKHGFAFSVGEAAFAAGDCEKASMFLQHFLAYGGPERQQEKLARAQELVTRIETHGCG